MHDVLEKGIDSMFWRRLKFLLDLPLQYLWETNEIIHTVHRKEWSYGKRLPQVFHSSEAIAVAWSEQA